MRSKSVSYTVEFLMNQTAGVLFPLFSPEGEKLWIPGWDYENVMGKTGLHENYVFLTKSHDHGVSEAIWIVSKYLPEEYTVQYYKIEPGEKIGVVTVRCDQADHTSTRVEVTYKYIGLSESGNQFIEQFTKKDYDDFIGEWKVLLESYFGITRTQH
jgi:hypothetical protein